VADDEGTKPPERRKARRRATPDGVESTGGRRVRGDRRKAPAADVGTVSPAVVDAESLETQPEVPVVSAGPADPDGTRIWSPAAVTVASMRTSMPGLSHPRPEPADASEDAPDDGPGMAVAAAALVVDPLPSLPVLEDRSPDPAVCPFLRAVDVGPDGRSRVVRPVESPDPANRCAALAQAVPQSLRQQELVCLTSGHINCPRYLRGAVVLSEPVAVSTRAGRAWSPAILASIAVLVMAFAASIAFVTVRGGLELAVAATARPSASDLAAASVPPSEQPGGVASAAPSEVATSAPSPTPTATPTPTPAPTPTPSPSPSPTPEPTPKATPRPTPRPTSARYQLLRPCSNASDCWIYTVRAGDNLFSIANYFGVSLDAVYARNPWARDTPLRAGMELRLPPPTR
jgi:hypothetical protein